MWRLAARLSVLPEPSSCAGNNAVPSGGPLGSSGPSLSLLSPGGCGIAPQGMCLHKSHQGGVPDLLLMNPFLVLLEPEKTMGLLRMTRMSGTS